ncbi:unnamed protein product [Rodentolepis nana]|uniref:Histone domain-containing protein n=1 Tax=Rodentolepis nana TaxID=102285 RepID=A0A0R3TBR7_RODNA|nr:unnamed protein product [Rodentolepis nana]
MQEARHLENSMSAPSTDGVEKPQCFNPETVALQDIRRYQMSTELFIWKMSFQRFVHEIAQEYKADLCFQATTVAAMQDAAEGHIMGRGATTLRVYRKLGKENACLGQDRTAKS